ncbi:hypothetical protein ACLIYP_05375 [Streptomyces nanhaiensis]|uniref:hypothetical protein n=1 Tax=Streptomyces nanhaiensis TaxID=679319 RepID=UPI00399C8D2F
MAPTACVEVEVVDTLPGGQPTMVLEEKGRIRFLILKGAPIEEIGRSLQGDMQHEIDSGLWDQHWPGGGGPGEGKESTEDGPDGTP